MNYVYDNLWGDICEEKFGEKGITLRYSISHVHTIQWTLNTLNIFRAHMRISLRCLCTRMTKKLLNIAQVCSVFQQMCSERVSQSMNATLFYNTRSLSSFFKNLLCVALRKMSI